MRLVDFRCDYCGEEWEEFEYDVPVAPGCRCWQPQVRRVLRAPAITGTRRYGHPRQKQPETARQLERRLAKSNSWIPTQREAREVRQMSEAGIDPVQINAPDPKRIDKAYEKALEKYHKEGLDRKSTVDSGGRQ